MITYKQILKCESFIQAETASAIMGIAKVNNEDVAVVAKAYADSNKSVIDCVEKHIIQSAKTLVKELNKGLQKK